MEQRLINANALLDKTVHMAKECFGVGQCYCLRTQFQKMIEDAPTADAVPVVRCGECKYNIGEKVWLDGDVTIDCDKGMGYPPPDWFCADGERRTDEQ